MAQPTSTPDEIRRSRELAGASREAEWKGKGFLRGPGELFAMAASALRAGAIRRLSKPPRRTEPS